MLLPWTRKPRVAPPSSAYVHLEDHRAAERAPRSSTARSKALSAQDKQCLQQSIDRLQNAHKVKNPVGFLTSEGTALLCASPNEIYDRLTAFLTNTGIVAGLVLSSIAGTALNPLNPDDFADEKRGLVEAFNVTAAVSVVTQLLVVLFATYTLYIITAAVHTQTAAYRAALHMTRWIGFLEFCSYIPALGTLGLIILAAQLRCDALAAWMVLGASIALLVCFQASFDLVATRAVPYAAWQWSLVASLGLPWLSGRVHADAKVAGELLLQQAKEGVLGGLDEDDDFVIDAAAETAEAEAALASWLQGVLTLTPTGVGVLAQRLFQAGLTRARMVEAAAHPGGFQSLCELLTTSELGLRPGERLALASAAMRERVVDPPPA
jgi:hypothetical protein